MSKNTFYISYPSIHSGTAKSKIQFFSKQPDLVPVLTPGENERKRLFVTDGTVASLECMQNFTSCFDDDVCGNDVLLVLGSGEAYKTIESVLNIIKKAIDYGFSRHDLLVGIGGGVICDLTAFDDSTIAGAIETIIAYARDTFNCPVAFYSGSYCVKENYPEMVDLLLKIQEKWDIGVVDLFNNPEMTAIYDTEQYWAYMFDDVHPNRAGYVEWWTPVIDAALVEYMSAQQ